MTVRFTRRCRTTVRFTRSGAVDFRIFADDARLVAGLVESRYGLLPDMGATVPPSWTGR